MTVEMRPVTSSNIEAVGHDPETGTLHVRFKSGGKVWTYPDVSADLYEKMLASSSVGSFFHRNIRQTRAGTARP